MCGVCNLRGYVFRTMEKKLWEWRRAQKQKETKKGEMKIECVMCVICEDTSDAIEKKRECGRAKKQKGDAEGENLAAIRFARFFSFRFRTRPRTFYGASERFAKPRMEIITSFSRATPCEP